MRTWDELVDLFAYEVARAKSPARRGDSTTNVETLLARLLQEGYL